MNNKHPSWWGQVSSCWKGHVPFSVSKCSLWTDGFLHNILSSWHEYERCLEIMYVVIWCYTNKKECNYLSVLNIWQHFVSSTSDVKLALKVKTAVQVSSVFYPVSSNSCQCGCVCILVILMGLFQRGRVMFQNISSTLKPLIVIMIMIHH